MNIRRKQKRLGPFSHMYTVKLNDGRVVCRHVDHVCDSSTKLPNDKEIDLDFKFFTDQSSTKTNEP